MNIDVSSLSIDKALSMAIQSELDTASTYKKLQQKVNNFVLKEKLKFLVFEEEKHYQILVALMQRLYPDKNNQSNMKSFFPKLSLILDEGISVPDLIEVAMEAEKAAEEFYDSLSQEVDERGVQEVLLYLSNMEHGHYALLKGEHELCIKDEMYYQRDDFQYDMVHIGP